MTVYLETNVFIYAVEGADRIAAPAKELLRAVRAWHPGNVFTSELTIAEVLAPPRRQDALPLHLKRRLYLDLLIWSRIVTLVPVSRDILVETADLRRLASYKLPDAIHLVSAIRSNCRFFISADNDFKRLPEGMTWVNPDERGIASLMKEIS